MWKYVKKRWRGKIYQAQGWFGCLFLDNLLWSIIFFVDAATEDEAKKDDGDNKKENIEPDPHDMLPKVGRFIIYIVVEMDIWIIFSLFA